MIGQNKSSFDPYTFLNISLNPDDSLTHNTHVLTVPTTPDDSNSTDLSISKDVPLNTLNKTFVRLFSAASARFHHSCSAIAPYSPALTPPLRLPRSTAPPPGSLQRRRRRCYFMDQGAGNWNQRPLYIYKGEQEPGSGQFSNSDLPIWTSLGFDNQMMRPEREESDWEEVNTRFHVREGRNSVIDQIEEIYVSSDTYNEDDEEE